MLSDTSLKASEMSFLPLSLWVGEGSQLLRHLFNCCSNTWINCCNNYNQMHNCVVLQPASTQSTRLETHVSEVLSSSFFAMHCPAAPTALSATVVKTSPPGRRLPVGWICTSVRSTESNLPTCPPNARALSATFAPTSPPARRLPVGWICTSARSIRRAPALSAMSRASPVAQGPLVVGKVAAVGLWIWEGGTKRRAYLRWAEWRQWGCGSGRVKQREGRI
eukprot:1156042-Pelagomonas_calceolata.AAC.3